MKQALTISPEHSFEEKWELAQARYSGTIRTFARNCVHQLPSMDLEDIEQELLVVLWKAVMNYNPDKGASFNTLFQGSCKNRVITLIRGANTKSRTGITMSLDVEATAAVVDAFFNESNVEDRALDRVELEEFVSQYGPEVFLGNKKVVRSVA